MLTVERPSASTLVSTSVSQPLLEQDVDFLQAELDLLSELDNEEQQRDKFSIPQEGMLFLLTMFYFIAVT